jgi:hypothetical protein
LGDDQVEEDRVVDFGGDVVGATEDVVAEGVLDDD